jgi:hypothetical protein
MSTSQETRNNLPQFLDNFSLEKLLFLARLELGLTSKEQNDLILLAICEEFNVVL